jgi:osmoprotectant transport system substrate-binding protein
MGKRIAALIATVLVVTAAAACGSGNPLAGGGAAGTVVVGSANFAENELLMEIYAAALRKAGVAVQTWPRLGTREITTRALADGSITVMPEYTGNLLHFLDPASTATTAEEVYAALRKALPPNMQVLEQSTAEDSDVLVVTQQTSARLGLTSMDALAPHCPQLTLGAAGEWPARWKDKIAQVYGCNFRQIVSTDAGGPVTLEALRSGQAQVVNLFTTSPDIAANHWVELADPKHMYPAQRVVALVRTRVLNQAGIDALNSVSAALTTAKLTELNRRVTQDRAVPADLAKEFVNGLP